MIIDLYSHFIPQNIWGGVQEYFHCNKNIYELKFGTWRGKYCWSPQGSISLAHQLTAHGILVFDTIYTLFQVRTLRHQPDLTVPVAASIWHLKLTWTPYLFPKPFPPTAFPVSRATPTISCCFSSPPWYALGWAPSSSTWISARAS